VLLTHATGGLGFVSSRYSATAGGKNGSYSMPVSAEEVSASGATADAGRQRTFAPCPLLGEAHSCRSPSRSIASTVLAHGRTALWST